VPHDRTGLFKLMRNEASHFITEVKILEVRGATLTLLQ
jgi:hypothetical protein